MVFCVPGVVSEPSCQVEEAKEDVERSSLQRRSRRSTPFALLPDLFLRSVDDRLLIALLSIHWARVRQRMGHHTPSIDDAGNRALRDLVPTGLRRSGFPHFLLAQPNWVLSPGFSLPLPGTLLPPDRLRLTPGRRLHRRCRAGSGLHWLPGLGRYLARDQYSVPPKEGFRTSCFVCGRRDGWVQIDHH